MTGPALSHDGLADLLAAHLRGNSDRMVWTNMQLGPQGSPRPDVWSLNKSYTSPRPLAYEVKVTKADYQRDVAAGKWQSYLAYSCAVVFVVPHGLVTKADLPKGCGLMTWNGEPWHTPKAPTLNVVPAFSRDLTMKLLIDGVERAAAHQRTESKRKWLPSQAFLKKFGAVAARAISEEIDFDEKLQQLTERYRKAEQEARERHDASRKRIDVEAKAAQAELCRALDISTDSDLWQIQARVRDLVRAVSRDSEVQALRRQLDSIRHALDQSDSTPNAKALSTVDGS